MSKFLKPTATTNKKNNDKNKKQEKKPKSSASSNDGIDKKANHLEKFKKEKTKPLYLRVPTSLWEDIHHIMAVTGISMNATCLELLRPEIKRKLKELKED